MFDNDKPTPVTPELAAYFEAVLIGWPTLSTVITQEGRSITVDRSLLSHSSQLVVDIAESLHYGKPVDLSHLCFLDTVNFFAVVNALKAWRNA